MEAARVCSRCWILRDKPGCDGWGDSAEVAAGLWCHQSPKSGAWGGVRVWGSTRPQPPAVGAGLTACPHQHRGPREPFGTPLKPAPWREPWSPHLPFQTHSKARPGNVLSPHVLPFLAIRGLLVEQEVPVSVVELLQGTAARQLLEIWTE